MATPLAEALQATDPRTAQVDRRAAELALWQHLSAVGAETTSYGWVDNIEQGFDRVQAEAVTNRFWSPSASGSWNRFSIWSPDALISYPNRVMPQREDPFGRPVFRAARSVLGRRWRERRTPRTYRRWRVSYADVPDPVNVHRLALAAVDEEAIIAAGKPVFDDYLQPESNETPIWRQRRQEGDFANADRTYESARYRLPVLEPHVRLWGAGVFAFWVLEHPHWRQRHCVIVPRPTLHVTTGRLHRDDGPAVEWPNGVSYWFWEGLPVPKKAVSQQSEKARLQVLVRTRNQELRRILLDRLGYDRFLQLADARLLQQDDYGKLWHTDLEMDGEPVTVVEVTNATQEADGSYRRYFLRVPPQTRTARAAVAWTFSYEDPYKYSVRVQS